MSDFHIFNSRFTLFAFVSLILPSGSLHTDNNHIFVFGAGYVGSNMCQTIKRTDTTSHVYLSASCRQSDRATALKVGGLCDESYVFDIDDTYLGLNQMGQAALADATHVFVTVPPVADKDRDPLLALHAGNVQPPPHGRQSPSEI